MFHVEHWWVACGVVEELSAELHSWGWGYFCGVSTVGRDSENVPRGTFWGGGWPINPGAPSSARLYAPKVGIREANRSCPSFHSTVLYVGLAGLRVRTLWVRRTWAGAVGLRPMPTLAAQRTRVEDGAPGFVDRAPRLWKGHPDWWQMKECSTWNISDGAPNCSTWNILGFTSFPNTHLRHVSP